MAEWSQRLRALRDEEGLTRVELAELASVAPATVKAYELGHRNPSRNLLTALLDALKADMHTRALVLSGAGFAEDGATPSRRRPDEYFDLLEATREVASSPFPACVSNEVMEVLAVNSLLQGVWGVDLGKALQGPYQRSMASMLSHPGVGARLRNWDETVCMVISILKGHYGGESSFRPDGNAYFAGAMDRFLEGERQHVQRFLELWEATPARQRKLRFSFPITWKHDRTGELHFLVQVNPADQRGALLFNDWIPLDGETWRGLDLLREGGLPPTFQAGAT